MPFTTDLALSIQTLPNLEFVLQYNPDLQSQWQDLATLTTNESGAAPFVHSGVLTASRGFYRIQTP